MVRFAIILPAVEPWRHRQRYSCPHPRPEVPARRARRRAKAVLDRNGKQLRQKLDCALQLARTLSLDFNNR